MIDIQRLQRTLLWFSVGFFLAAYSMLTFAETIPATAQQVEENYTATNIYRCSGWSGYYSSPTAVCASGSNLHLGTSGGNSVCMTASNGVVCDIMATCPSGYTFKASTGYCVRTTPTYSCPANQGWTLQGTNCTRPDCASGQVRDPTSGQCIQNCTVPVNQEVGQFSIPAGTSLEGGFCINGCRVFGPSGTVTKSPTKTIGTFYSYGEICSVGQATPTTPTEADTTCASRGLCSASVNGNNACAPCSETKTQQTTQGATGSTTTTTTCNAAGACSTTTTNNTNTTTVNSSSSTNGKGTAISDGQGNYKLDLPTDYQRDATGKETNQLLTDIKDVIGNPVDDDSSITNAGANEPASKALSDADKDVKDRVSGITEDGSVSGSVSAWSTTMSSGWFASIPMTGCVPFTATIAGRSWTLDHCPTAAKISDIGAYCMWILLCFTGFRLVTTPRRVEA